MNKVLYDCIPEITMPFLDDIPMKGCAIEDKNETVDDWGCRKFVTNHIHDCKTVLQKLEDARLTLSGEKWSFTKTYWYSDICAEPRVRNRLQRRSTRFNRWKRCASRNRKFGGSSEHVRFIVSRFCIMPTSQIRSTTCYGKGWGSNGGQNIRKEWWS